MRRPFRPQADPLIFLGVNTEDTLRGTSTFARENNMTARRCGAGKRNDCLSMDSIKGRWWIFEEISIINWYEASLEERSEKAVKLAIKKE